MFYDERIESEKGRISRNCIIISVIIALILSVPRILNIYYYINSLDFYIPYEYFLTAATEITVVISGVLGLHIGFFYKIKEEDGEYKKACKSAFYNKVAKIHLFACLTAFSISCAAMLRIGTLDTGIMGIFTVFIMAIFTYIAYEFKKREIYFNYSIIEDDRYYTKVLINIAKFGLIMVCFMLLSWVANIIISAGYYTDGALGAMKNISSTYYLAFMLCSLAYFIYSILEKTSYDNESALLSKAPFVTLLVAAIISVISILIYVKIMLSNDYLTSAYAYLVSALKNLSWICIAAFSIYLNHEYQRERKSKLLDIGTKIFALTIPVYCFISQFITLSLHFAQRLIMLSLTGTELYEKYQLMHTTLYESGKTISDITAVLQFIAVIFILNDLMKHRYISDFHSFILLAFIAVCTVYLILRAKLSDTIQGAYIINLFRLSVFTAVIVYACIVTLIIKRKKAKEAKIHEE